MIKIINKKFAFSLAEALVVLGVVAVVAALTIPTLVQNSQNAALAAKAKKAYYEFNNALDQITTDYDCLGNLKCTGLFASGVANSVVGSVFVKYFDVAKDCGVTDLSSPSVPSCMPKAFSKDKDGGTTMSWEGKGYYQFITTDGVAYSIENFGYGCADKLVSTGATGNMNGWCGVLRMDVTGPEQGPNVMGRDVLVYYITDGKGAMIYPIGGVDEKAYSTTGWWKTPGTGVERYCLKGVPDTNTNSNRCTGRLIEEGWKMNY